MTDRDKPISGELVTAHNDAAAVGTQGGTDIAARTPDAYQIKEALHEIIEQMGHSPGFIMISGGNSGWWEVFSHGLSMPVHDTMDTFYDVPSFLTWESDFLQLDHEGLNRTFGEAGALDKEEPLSEKYLRMMAFRVIAFTQTRARLAEQGFSMPDNPDLARAADRVRSEVAKNVTDLDIWRHLSGEARKTLPEAAHE